MKKTQWLQKILQLAITVMVLLISMNAQAGWFSEDEQAKGDEQMIENIVEVKVTDVSQYGAIQIFDYLLGKISGVSSVRQVSQQLDPARPEQSFTTWQVRVIDEDGLYIERELYQLLEFLDEDSIDDILEKISVSFSDADYRQLKKIRPVYASIDRAYYTADINRAETSPLYTGNITGNILPDTRSTNPWLAVPGAGFE